ncbi:MAG: AI-2E family transporter [Trueperaceae bacterium]
MDILKPLWQNVYLRFILLGAGLFVLYLFVRLTRDVWIALIVAYLIAYLLNPFITWIERKSNRIIGMASLVIALFLFIGFLSLIGVQISSQFSAILLQVPSLLETLQEIPYRLARFFDPRFGTTFEQIYINVQGFSQSLLNTVLPSLERAQNAEGNENILQTLIQLGGGGAQVGIIFVLSIYFIYNFDRYTRSFLRAFPHRHRPIIEELTSTAGQSVGGYVRGQILISVFVGFFTFIGLSLVGVPLALALGVLTGLCNLIPYLGPILAALPTVIVAFTEGNTQVIGALVVLLVVNQIDANVISPMVMSRTSEIDPVTVIVAILFGIAFFGLLGAVIAVPLAAFLKVIYTHYYIEGGWYKRPPQKAKAEG